MQPTAAFTTTFPDCIQQQIGGGFVLVVKNMMDFEWCKPRAPDDLGGVDAHVQWFHNFWWTSNADTRPKLVAFFDSKEEAVEAGVKFAMTTNGHIYNWAVYNSAAVLVDGKY